MGFINIFAALALSGCGAEKPQPSMKPQLPEPYEIVWYQVGDGMTPDVQEVCDAVARMCPDLNISLKLVYFGWGDYNDKMTLIINSKDKFDICFAATWTGFRQNVSRGAYIDITELFYENMPRYSAILDQAFVEGAKVGGRLFALPTNKELFSHVGIEIDTELAALAGIDPSKVNTLEDMDWALRVVKEKLPGIIPFYIRQGNELRAGIYDASFGEGPGAVMLDDQTCTVINQYETEEKMGWWRTTRKWYIDGLINQDSGAVMSNEVFEQGKAFSRSGALGVTPEWLGPAGTILKRITLGDRYTSTETVTSAMIAFSSTSADLGRVMEFYDRFATTPSIYNTLAYGIEGKHYVIADKSTDPWTWDFPPGVTTETVGYSSCDTWALGGDWFSTFLSKADPLNRNEITLLGNELAVSSPVLGFSFDPSDVQAEITACGNVMSEYLTGLDTGMLDPDIYAPEFVAKLNEAGAERIIEEKQRQIDLWKIEGN
ncbi:MAG: ABC transporter substrate-binding protein [Clostridiales bacterium]|nr:ABC transporter substrate-binding protein [Clostridiales bacterium]